jgi:hypothetical protein
MERREFLTKAGAAGLITVSGGALMAQVPTAKRPGESDVAYRTRLAQLRKAQIEQMERVAAGLRGRQYYELRKYEIETDQQKAGFDRFAAKAALPALNRLGIGPVGVFYPNEGLSPIYVLIPHSSMESFNTLMERLGEDEQFLQDGAEFLDAPASAPAYRNLEISLHRAFESIPRLETPVKEPGRVFQLRIYESPSEKTGLKKIEMFDVAELAIFRRVGLHPVFFGQTLAGPKMPNLIYMLGFKDMDESKANWKKFGADPEWKELRVRPEYLDREILRKGGITNMYLRPAEYSQI